MGLIITLIIVGIVLILAEILVIPGVGVTGVLGLLSMGGSCFYSFHEYGNLTGGIVTGANALVLVVLLIYVLRAKTWKGMSLETSIDTKAVEDSASIVAVGDHGVTLTRLAPAGSVRFGESVVEARSMEGMLESGVEVEVVIIEDNRIIVRNVQ